MLKIYLCTFKYEIHNENEIVELNTYSDYEIIDEKAAVSKTAEFGAYTDIARDAYIYSSNIKQKRKANAFIIGDCHVMYALKSGNAQMLNW